MFQFDLFPEILKAHKKSRQLSKKINAAEIKNVNRGGDPNKDSKWQSVLDEGLKFDSETYPQIIYNVFSPIKPDLTIKKTGEIIKWDSLFFNKPFDELSNDQKTILYLMVEAERPYLLPQEYYNKTDRISNMLNNK